MPWNVWGTASPSYRSFWLLPSVILQEPFPQALTFLSLRGCGQLLIASSLYIFLPLQWKGTLIEAVLSIVAGKGQALWEKKKQPPNPEKGQLAVVSVPPKSTIAFGTLSWVHPNIRFSGKSISAGRLAALEPKPMVQQGRSESYINFWKRFTNV